MQNSPLEEVEQRALVQWLKLKKIPYFAVANENIFSFLNRNLAVKIQAKQKALGAIKGVSDLCIMLPNKILFIELKRSDPKLSKVSKEQIAFLKEVNKLDYAYGDVAYGYLEAIEIIERFMK